MNVPHKCPICDGLGWVTPHGLTGNTQEVCPKCKGAMVVWGFNASERGFPPAGHQTSAGATSNYKWGLYA